MARRGNRRGKDRAALLWFGCFFVAAQLALAVALELRDPAVYDPEFEVRLRLLQTRIAEAPDRPLLLLLGSSRMVADYRPEKLPPLAEADGRRPLAFNFSHLAAVPVMNLLDFDRLRRRDVRPRWLVVEVMPAFLGDENPNIITDTQSALDLPLTTRYAPAWKACALFARARLAPWYKHRAFLMYNCLPRWLPAGGGPSQARIALGPLGGDYDWMQAPNVTAERVRDSTAFAERCYRPLLQGLHVSDESGRSWRELLGRCRDEGIAVVMILTPEGTAFRSWYPPEARRLVDDYSARLSAEYGVPLIDARGWLDDGDFVDSHHLTPHGADLFTERLGREVLVPLVEGKLHTPPAAPGAGAIKPTGTGAAAGTHSAGGRWQPRCW